MPTEPSERPTAVRVVADQAVSDAVRRAVRAAVSSVGARVVGDRELRTEPPGAWELCVDGDPRTLRRPLREVGASYGVDVAVAGAVDAGRRRLVVLDVDSTLIEHEVIELIAEHAGTRPQVEAVTAAAMRGELDFAESLRARVETLAGLDVAVLEEVRRAVRLTPGARTLVAVLHHFGDTVGAVSGGFHEILDPLAADLRLDHAQANRLEVRDGRLTGRVDGEIVDRGVKAAALRRWAAADGVDPADAVAVGDGANDLDMLAAAGLGVAFCAKPALREAADVSLTVRRLDLVLHLMGFTERDVAAALESQGG